MTQPDRDRSAPRWVEFSDPRPCQTCGEPHGVRRFGGPNGVDSWHHPDDGHGYFPPSWEEFARSLLAATQPPADSEGSVEPWIGCGCSCHGDETTATSCNHCARAASPVAESGLLKAWEAVERFIEVRSTTITAEKAWEAWQDALLAAAAPPAGGLDVERLAALEHQQWIEWASTLLLSEPGISKERRTRWQRLIATPYDQLTEAEKHQDRVYAEKVARLASRDQEEGSDQ